MRHFGLVLFFVANAILAQRVRFVPLVSDQPLVLDKASTLPDGTPVTITQFRFYAGHFAFYCAGQVISRSDGYRLIDVADTASLLIDPDVRNANLADSISFALGVDSLTNVSGALSGDLDPTKGMYWTWNSGYINLKLEGSSPVSPYPSHQFELHLGGYLPPHTTAQHVALEVKGRTQVTVDVDVAPLLKAADLRTRCNLMRPGARATELARIASTMFSAHEDP